MKILPPECRSRLRLRSSLLWALVARIHVGAREARAQYPKMSSEVAAEAERRSRAVTPFFDREEPGTIGRMKAPGKRFSLVAAAIVVTVVGLTAFHYRARIRFGWLFEPIGRNAQGYPEYRHRQTGIVFVKVPGGTFWMGSSREEVAEFQAAARRDVPGASPTRIAQIFLNEEPRHRVTLSPFLIAKCEVTQAQWRRVMGFHPFFFQPGGKYEDFVSPGGNTDDLPAENVSWNDSQGFCRRTGLRLPTEAQWEFACRPGAEGFSSGPIQLAEAAWYAANSGERTHPVGEKEPNALGLHDMLGNVSEWCEDTYHAKFYRKAEASGKDPLHLSAADTRVVRGGDWSGLDWHDRPAIRGHWRRSTRGPFGLRPAFWPLPE